MSEGETRVTFGPRLGAWLIDLVVLAIAAAVLSPFVADWFSAAITQALAENAAAAGKSGAEMPPEAKEMMVKWTTTMLRWGMALGLLAPAYYLLEGLTGRTLGKLILGYKVGGADGRPAPIGKLLSRFAIKSAANVVSIVGTLAGVAALSTVSAVVGLVLVGGSFMVLGRNRQALHDRLTGVAVYRKSDLESAAAA